MPYETEPVTTCVLFPGLDAIFGISRIRRWLDFPEVVSALSETSQHLSEFTGEPEDLGLFLGESVRPYLEDFDRMMVALAGLQVGIAREVTLRSEYEILTGCSHGDLARLVIAESITVRDMVEFVWMCAKLKSECPRGMTAYVRPLKGKLTEGQLEWLAGHPIALSRWSERHATASGSVEAIETLADRSREQELKVRTVLPYPIHSSLIHPVIEDGRKIIDGWRILPPRYRMVSSVYARAISEPEEIKQEAVDGASSAIRWTETLSVLTSHFSVKRFIIIGPNAALATWMRESETFAGVELVDAWDLCGEVSAG